MKGGRKGPCSTNSFKRIAYWLDSNPNLVLVHYLGDEIFYQAMPHETVNMTLNLLEPSVVEEIKF
jgi:hypothetical protein